MRRSREWRRRRARSRADGERPIRGDRHRIRTDGGEDDAADWERHPLFEYSSDCVVALRFEREGAVVVDVNPPFERVFGYDAADLRGRPLDALIAPDDELERATLLSERARDNERFETVVTRTTATGEERTFRLQSIPVADRATGVDGFAVYTDLTGERRFLAHLSDLHEHTRRLMDATDPTEVAKCAVDAATDLLGYDVVTVHLFDPDAEVLRPEINSETVTDVLGAEVHPLPVDDSVAGRVFRQGVPAVSGDVRDDPDVANVETPLRSEMAFPLGDHGVFTVATTEADAFDDHDVALAEILAANVEAALDRAERESEVREQNERLDNFASIVSHDLRNPLHAAEGYVELTRETGETDHLERVERNLERMESLIDDLLLLARGESRVEPTDGVDLEAAVRAAWEATHTREATLSTPADLGTIRADRNRLEELLGNLFRNAVEHGGDDVAIRVERLDDGGFAVVDDGAGIDEAVRDTLMEAGVTTNESGTGLGLSIVHRIAEAHGWHVTVDEAGTGGARFEFHPETASSGRDGTTDA